MLFCAEKIQSCAAQKIDSNVDLLDKFCQLYAADSVTNDPVIGISTNKRFHVTTFFLFLLLRQHHFSYSTSYFHFLPATTTCSHSLAVLPFFNLSFPLI